MPTIQPQVLKMLRELPSGPANFYLESLLDPDLVFNQLPARAKAHLTQMSNPKSFREHIKAKPKPFVGVAEGDSWFDYLPAYFDLDLFNGDLLGELNDEDHFHVFKVAKAGDTLDNMVFGPNNTGEQLRKTLQAIEANDARFFLFSGGGNDVAGPELERFLFPAASAPDPSLPIRKDVVEAVLGKAFTATFNHLIDEVRRVSPKIAIFLHGYDFAVPDGRAVINIPFGFHFVGPWLKPAFVNKGITAVTVQQRVIDFLIDRLNKTIAAVAKQRASHNVHHIDVRGTLTKSRPSYRKDWANELHPTGRGWKKVANLFTAEILAVLQSK